MSIFEDTNPRELKELLAQIHAREAALPDFQRDFVWDPKATQELILSIMQNYPAGSLLRIRNTKNLFACREFQGAPPLNGAKTTYLILDGQQRLTSLYQAFFGVGDHRFFLDVGRLLEIDDPEECLFHVRASHPRAKALSDFAEQAKSLVLPLSVLKGGSGGFTRWSHSVAKLSGNRDELEEKLFEVEERWIRTVDDYKFPVVTLSDSTSAEAVCTIFETLNRTGVKLSPFELLTARFWPQGVNLRERWGKAQADHGIIADFDVDPYYVLQSIALLTRTTPSCKRSDVLDLEANAITQWWDKTVAALADTLRVLRDDCGVIVPKWMPYATILIPAAAIIAKVPTMSGPKGGANREKFTRWFWCSVFGQTYENSANSRAAKDFSEMVAWLQGGNPPDAITRFRFDGSSLRDITVRQRGLYAGCMALILRNRPRDFHTDAPITGDLIVENRIDDHHVFPSAWGRDNLPKELRAALDSVLNRTLIDRFTNIRISSKAPSMYLKEIANERGEAALTRLLDSHLLPSSPDSTLRSDSFEEFLEDRQELLLAQLENATGIPIRDFTLGGEREGDEWDEDDEDENETADGLTREQRKERRRRFWEQLLKAAGQRIDVHSGISPRSGRIVRARAGVRGVYYGYLNSNRSAGVEIYIDTKDGSLNRRIFRKLMEFQEEIESELGAELDWDDSEDIRAVRIRRYIDSYGFKDETKWPVIIENLVDGLVKLHGATYERLRSIVQSIDSQV